MRALDADVVIAGGGLAAQRACETLRRLGYDGRVRVVCEEPHAPYDRPPLSKGMLTGARALRAPSLRQASWYAENDVELLLANGASAVDPAMRVLELCDGSKLRYEHLVVATGSRPRRLAALAPGGLVLELRTLDDAVALRHALTGGVERIAIVGAGLIGMEVASSASSLGVAVTLIEAAPMPLARALPPRLAEWLCDQHRRAGVEVELGVGVERVHTGRRGVELVLADGRRVSAGLVLVAAGTVAATEWLAGSGLSCDGPIRVDADGRSAVPRIYVAGDAACFPDPLTGRHLPTPHWEAAAHQGAAVARAVVGAARERAQPPMFWSDQHRVRIQVLGRAEETNRIDFDGDPKAPDFIAWLRRGERLLGAFIAGRPRAVPEVRRRLAAADSDQLRAAA